METHVMEEEAAQDESSGSVRGDTDSNATVGPEPPKPRFSYRVPPNVCFGHSSVRGFRGRRGRRK
ncbi:unnamed protein product [Tetraodon nigroviridis]|uniref:(spotted green pufferfish) hypothetical protein n=1 Tax=Tetraodon nigroviridis TaxID=99883 RepID=Q4RQE3_TETNG|nr:unnamed protein product [Tetraodon nigroviridis]